MIIIALIVGIIDALISIGLLIIRIGKIQIKKENAEFIYEYNPKVLVIIPARGTDYEMSENLKSIKNQSYNNYEIVAVIDDLNDKALDQIKANNMNFILSNANCNNCSGKVKAIYSALLKFKDFQCYVIADSDIRVDRDWLKNLIKPLSNNEYGISTTFPKFYPEKGFWSHFKMYWGMIGESMMESKITRFAWGGSLAFRNDLLNDEDLIEFSNSIADDISLLKIAKRKGLKVAYVSEARVNIHSPDDFSTFLEWSNRQTALSIYFSNSVFVFGMIYYCLAAFLIISSIAMTIIGYYFFIILLAPIFYVSYDNYRKAPVKDSLFLLYNFFLYFFYIYNLISGKQKKTIMWRGRRYKLD